MLTCEEKEEAWCWCLGKKTLCVRRARDSRDGPLVKLEPPFSTSENGKLQVFFSLVVVVIVWWGGKSLKRDLVFVAEDGVGVEVKESSLLDVMRQFLS